MTKRKPPVRYTPPGHQNRPWEPGQPTTGPGAPGSPDPGPPPPPIPPAPAPPAPAGPPPVNWDALVQQDPQYIAALAALTRQRHDALVNFGDTSGIPGADAATAGEASNNPYSVVSLLRQQLGQNQRNLATTANAHGVLFSGTADQNRTNEADAGLQRSFNARQQLLGILGGYTDQQGQAYADAEGRIAANPPVSPTDPAAPPPPPAAAPVAPGLGPNYPGSQHAVLPTTVHPYHAPPLSTKPSATRPGYKPPRVLPARYTG